MLSIFKKVWGVYKPLRKAFIGIFVVLFITIGLDFVWPYIYGRTIDSVIQGRSLHTLLVFLAIALSVMLIQNLISWLGGILQLTYVDYDSPTLVANSSLKHLLTLSVGQHRNEHSSLTQSVISDGQNGTHNLLQLVVYQFLPYALRIFIGLIVLFIFSWMLGLVVFAGVMLSLIIMYISNTHFMPFIRQERDMDQEVDKRRMEVLRNAPLVISSSGQSETFNEVVEETNKINNFGKSFWRKYFRVAYVIRPSIQDITLIGTIGVAAFLVAHGQLSAGLILTVILWTNTILINMGSLGGLQRQMLFSSERARKYFNIMDVKSDVKQAESPVRPATFNGQIIFDNVSFVYSEKRIIEDDEEKAKKKRVNAVNATPREALVHMSFQIKAGEHVAFVGSSGAGKSTTLLLLLRGSDPQEGSIKIDGIDLREIDIDFYRRHLGVVEQHIVLFDDTIRRNISFGLPDGAQLTDAELDKLAHIARIDEFKDKLVEGWDTIIGENGIKLSGGQRQRVGIARALAKSPAILILDEATSSLDAKNEALIKDALHDASEGRTTIMIAHRLSTVKDADRIFVFDKGEIIGVGKHEELLETCPTYADLVSHQTVIL